MNLTELKKDTLSNWDKQPMGTSLYLEHIFLEKTIDRVVDEVEEAVMLDKELAQSGYETTYEVENANGFNRCHAAIQKAFARFRNATEV